MTYVEYLLEKIAKNLDVLIDKSLSRSNIHAIHTFDTSGTETTSKDVGQMLGLPQNKYIANEFLIFDKGGGFSFRINGQDPAVDASDNLTISQEDIRTIEFTSVGIAGTAKVRFSAYIPRV